MLGTVPIFNRDLQHDKITRRSTLLKNYGGEKDELECVEKYHMLLKLPGNGFNFKGL